jgi:hypothetical protein
VTDRTAVRRSRVYLGFALAAGAFSALISALIVDGLNDGDWSLGAWEWPETVTTALVLILFGLWIAPLVIARVTVTRNAPIRKLVNAQVERHDTTAHANGQRAPVEIARATAVVSRVCKSGTKSITASGGRRRTSFSSRSASRSSKRRSEPVDMCST